MVGPAARGPWWPMRVLTLGSFVLFALANAVLFGDLWRLNRTAGHGPLSLTMIVIGLFIVGLGLSRAAAVRLAPGRRHWGLTMEHVVIAMNAFSVVAVSGYEPVTMLRAQAAISVLGGAVIGIMLMPPDLYRQVRSIR
jgi:hypothetical protein